MRILALTGAVAAVLVLSVAGCGSATGKRDEVSRADTLYASEWTAGVIDRPQLHAPAVTLIGVRTGSHDGFDRVVFEFAERVPGYHIEYIDRPVRKCGSGEVTQVGGDGWLEVRMSPANAHTEQGRPTVAERERMPRLPLLAELELTCDFEAMVTWVLGVESPNRYRVQELTNPPRLVVDVRH